jgi:hypothetical protein
MLLKAFMTDCSLPMLKRTIENRLKIVQKKLKELPEPETDSQSCLLGLCREFVDEIKADTESGPFIPRKEFERLAKELRDAQPKFDLSQELGEDINAQASKEMVSELGFPSYNTSGDPDRILSLRDIRMLVDVKRGLELEPLIPWGVYHFAIRRSLQKWKTICFASFENVEKYLKELVATCASRIFHNFQASGLVSSATYCSF